jgi:hypothetical protein
VIIVLATLTHAAQYRDYTTNQMSSDFEGPIVHGTPAPTHGATA